jgi:hypothetical protein
MEIRPIALVSSLGRRLILYYAAWPLKNTESPKLVEFVSLNL